ncbi:unnamed protein product [Gongylonema pulchrum]|uniref:Auxin_canalis domain-containing protein n=1 Tax=Gongylonema pulchrum TaxID=637853 RepID=A0A183EBJ1_9BILA|nr:unnamed protein product [Gongylonema pulchrum]
MGSSAELSFDEKALLSSAEASIPLWLNCAATAAALPFEQSFLMAQRSARIGCSGSNWPNMFRAERKSAPAAVTPSAANNCFSINRLLGASVALTPKPAPNEEQASGTVPKDPEPAATQIPGKEAASSSGIKSNSEGTKTENDLLAALHATTRLHSVPSIPLNQDATSALNFPKSMGSNGSISDRKLMGSSAELSFDEKALLSSAEASIPLWLNCAATAAALPFEQSFLMAQRSGKLTR